MQPLGKGASSSRVNVFPNLKQGMIITYTLALTRGSPSGSGTNISVLIGDFRVIFLITQDVERVGGVGLKSLCRVVEAERSVV
jgi:ribulose-5-phosphate 4-epimerase/fuculose-1-phosphate aldolase